MICLWRKLTTGTGGELEDLSERLQHLLEVEEDGLRVFGLCLRVGGVQGFLGEAVDLAMEVEDGATRLQAHACLKVLSRHRRLLLGM